MRIYCDIDGVLLDSYTTVFTLYQRAFQSIGYDLREEVFGEVFWGKEFDSTTMAESLSVSQSQLLYVRSLKMKMSSPGVYKGLGNRNLMLLLIQLHESPKPYYRVQLITCGSSEATVHKLKALGLSTIPCCMVTRTQKVNPEYWKDKVPGVVIEDNVEVLAAAKEAGMLCWHIEYGGGHDSHRGQ